MHTEGYLHGGTYTWMNIPTEANAPERTYTQRDIDMDEHTHGGDKYIVQTV